MINVERFEQITASNFGDSITIDANADDVRVFGEGGDDRIVVGSARVTAYGGAGDDTFVIEGLGTSIFGDDGNDTIVVASLSGALNGGSGTDRVYFQLPSPTSSVRVDLTSGTWGYRDPIDPNLASSGTIGNVELVGGTANNDELIGDSLSNTLIGENGNDRLFGNGGSDTLSGDDGDDYLVGGAGNDALRGGIGTDVMIGGLGDDYYQVEQEGDVAYEVAGEGSDRIASTVNITLPDQVEGLELAGSAIFGFGNELANTIVGNTSANRLAGFGGNDRLEGGAGDDAMDGGEGNDVLLGGTGADLLLGGAGNDIYEVDNIGDAVWEAADNGTADNVFAYVDYALPWNVENLIMLYGNQRFGYGNSGDNIIIGNSADNAIEGGAGYDTMTGGGGSDLYVVRPGWGVDVITDFVAGGGTQDAVLFDSRLFTSFAQVMGNSAQVGNDTWIGDGLGNTVVLVGVQKTSLHPDDFGFI